MTMEIYTCEEVATMYHCTPATIRKLCREGQLAAVKFGKHWTISQKAITEYIDKQLQKQQNAAAQAVIDTRSLQCQFTKTSMEYGRSLSVSRAAQELDDLLKPRTAN